MTNGKPTLTMAEVKAMAKRRETEVRICLAGDLAADADRVIADLDALDRQPATSLADGAVRAKLVEELETLRGLMQESEVTFRFRALPPKELSDLIAAHPGGPEQDWDPETLPPDLVARCAIEPKMTLEEAEELFGLVNDGQRGELFTAAWRANNASTSVPTSRVASVNPALSDAR